ncbi:MFS transporter [Corynebacterium sp.]|uniref:MFS transporter n=1 Tax=Corynebacterium sp. TaxID=1720 RepID=UPI0026DCE4B1|nr:MFS transporter [Corynebacterium sp.]MDO4610620.1 MFS transporter [Corynebacterium sp.]
MFAALRSLTYRRLYVAQIIALAGTGLATVALGLLAYDFAGERAGQVLGTALMVKMVAYVLVAPFASALVANLPRRMVLVGADVLRVAVAAALPFVTATWQIYVLVFVLQAASATFTPTFQSVIPDVLPDEGEYTSALSLSRLAYDLEAIVSPMLAAALLLVVPSSALFLGTSLGFVASAALVLSCAIPATGSGAASSGDSRGDAPRDGEDAGEGRPFLERVRRGAVLFTRTPGLRPILALNMAVAAAVSFVLVQTVVVAGAVLGLPESGVAWLLFANGAGSMAAAFALPTLLRHVPEGRIMLPSATVLALAIAATPFALDAASLPAVVVLWVVIGVAWSSVETPVGRIIRRNVAGPDLPAAFAGQFSLSHACWLLAYPLAGWLGAGRLDAAAWTLAAIAGAAAATAALLWWRADEGSAFRDPGGVAVDDSAEVTTVAPVDSAEGDAGAARA